MKMEKKEIRNNSPDNLTAARAAATFQSHTFFPSNRHENISPYNSFDVELRHFMIHIFPFSLS